MRAYNFLTRPATDESITMMLDKGLGPNELTDLLMIAGNVITFAKFGWGTAAITDQAVIQQKNALYHDHGIKTYPGGTLLEVALLQGEFEQFLTHSIALGFNAIEVSDGSSKVDPATRHQVIQEAKDAGLTVISEVGKKNPVADQQLSTADRQAMIAQDLGAGSDYVILEAREAGKGIGIYDEKGQIIEDELSALTQAGVDRLIIEAPQKAQQVELLRRFGPQVNLGNIAASDVVSLQTLREGLRGDTVADFQKPAAAQAMA